MRQLMFVQAGRVAWDEAPDPHLPDSRGALVRPLAVARCDLDQPMAAFGIFPGPFAVGHETVAEVVAVGEEGHGTQRVASTRSRCQRRSCPGTGQTRRGWNPRPSSCWNEADCS